MRSTLEPTGRRPIIGRRAQVYWTGWSALHIQLRLAFPRRSGAFGQRPQISRTGLMPSLSNCVSHDRRRSGGVDRRAQISCSDSWPSRTYCISHGRRRSGAIEERAHISGVGLKAHLPMLHLVLHPLRGALRERAAGQRYRLRPRSRRPVCAHAVTAPFPLRGTEFYMPQTRYSR